MSNKSVMNYKLLGKSGLRVSEISLGAMTFGTEWGWGASKDESRKIFDLFVEAGGNFIDTANKYTIGTSEKMVGEFVGDDRDRFVIATKYTLSMRDDDPNGSGNHRKNMMQSVEASLKRLNTDYIDLYWVHAWDYLTPVEEIMRGLDDLVRSGKVLYVGISDAPAWRVAQANTLAELRGWTPFVGLQIEYSLIERTVERELIPMARAFDMAITPWSPLGGGVLTGKYRKSGDKVEAEDSKRADRLAERVSEKTMSIIDELNRIAFARNATPAQVAINWVRQQPGLMIPIIGARTEKQLSDSLGCLDFELTDDELDDLNKVSSIEMGFPHDFLRSETIKPIVYGSTYDRIKSHRECL